MMSEFKVISLNIAMSLLSISDVLRIDEPELLFLQEVNSSTQTLCSRVSSLGYWGECNVDPVHPNLPGTAVVWKKSLKVSEVNQILERRVMSLRCACEVFVNIYAPSPWGPSSYPSWLGTEIWYWQSVTETRNFPTKNVQF